MFKEYLLRAETEEAKNWINVNLKNYLKTNPENTTEIEHIIDYFNNTKPARLKKMSYEEAKTNTEKWDKSLQKKGAKFNETEEDVEVILDFKNGVKLVQLVGKNAFSREGYLMRHCVASYYGKKSCAIYSLRDAENQPHCTIEVEKNNERIVQIKGRGNGKIHPRYIKYILKALPKIGMEIRDNDMINLGYENLPTDYWKFIETHFEGVQYIMMNNKKFFYHGSKLKARR